jgi:NAD-dependent deacetylase
MKTAPNIVVLTGAGISRESGLHTFRDADGAWNRVRLEDVATPEAFQRNPHTVHAFYNGRRAELPRVVPNAAHLALAELERRWPAGFLLVTQNVDDLHERAGSANLLHMHGELKRVRCLRCDRGADWEADLSTTSACPHCVATGYMRPDIVWFGEMPMHMARIYDTLRTCGLFLSIGTSGAVYPAAGFVAEVRGRARTVELNLEPSNGFDLFDEAYHGPATEVVPEFVRRTLAAWS